jgi:hypothetical protein
MSMIGDIATEATVEEFVKEIDRLIIKHRDSPEAMKALKEAGRFALTQFDYTTPAWAHTFAAKFRE